MAAVARMCEGAILRAIFSRALPVVFETSPHLGPPSDHCADRSRRVRRRGIERS